MLQRLKNYVACRLGYEHHLSIPSALDLLCTIRDALLLSELLFCGVGNLGNYIYFLLP